MANTDIDGIEVTKVPHPNLIIRDIITRLNAVEADLGVIQEQWDLNVNVALGRVALLKLNVVDLAQPVEENGVGSDRAS